MHRSFFRRAVPGAVSLRHGFAEHTNFVAVTVLFAPVVWSGFHFIVLPFAVGQRGVRTSVFLQPAPIWDQDTKLLILFY